VICGEIFLLLNGTENGQRLVVKSVVLR